MKQRTFDASRTGALSDGVFAIAMTLLVLDLRLPELSSASESITFAQGLLEQSPRFASWFLSFVILCRLWIMQHAVLTGGDTRSRSFVGWNFLFLGAISFLPYPTSLLSEHHDQSLSVIFFSSVLAVAGVALKAMSKTQQRYQSTSESPDAMTRSVGLGAVFLLITAAVAAGAAAVSPMIGTLVWAVFPIAVMVVQRWKGQAASTHV